MTKSEKAMELFGNGCNCSQAVLMVYAQENGVDPEVVERMAVAFGGGMSKQGKTCGCLSGALMAIGLRYGSQSTTELVNRRNSYQIGKIMIERFTDLYGASECKELIRLDLNKENDMEIAMKQVFGSRCKAIVGKTVELLEDILSGN